MQTDSILRYRRPRAPFALPLRQILSLLVLLWAFAPAVAGANADAPVAAESVGSEPTDAELRTLIETLEDEQARSRLVAQLRLMLEAREEPASERGDATSEALRDISSATADFFDRFVVAAAGLEEIPQVAAWAGAQAADPAQRRVWGLALVDLALVLAAGYVALYLLRLGLRRPRRRLSAAPPRNWWSRIPLLGLTGLLELLPIAGFAAAAYLTLGLAAPEGPARLVALAWINAIVLVRLLSLAGTLIFAADAPQLRLPPLDDAGAAAGKRWVRRLSGVGVYGYFLIQSAAFLGLPEAAFEALLRLLGFLVTLLLLILILQQRAAVAGWIRGAESAERRPGAVRSRLAAVWHIPAALYLFLLFGIWALRPEDGFTTLLRGSLLTLLVLAAGAAAFRILERLFAHGLKLPAGLLQRLPGLQTRSGRYLPAARMGLRALLYLLIGLGLLQAWGLNGFGWLLQGSGQVLAGTVARLFLILGGALALWELTSLAVESYLAENDAEGNRRIRSARSRTLLSVARTAVAVVLSVVAILAALSEIGIDIAPLLAAAGVLGLAVGFGAQKLVQDLITGFFILLEDLFSVGDVIKVGDRAGLVEAVSIRNVRLRDLSGTVHTLPFSSIDTISNLTKEFSFHVFDLGVAYRENVDQVMEILRAIGAELRADAYFGGLILEDLEVFGLDSFGDSAIVIKGRIKTLPIRQWEVGREFNRRVKQRFDELGIEIPFPHRTLYFGEDKDGSAPPLRLRREAETESPRPRTAAVRHAGDTPAGRDAG